MSFIGKAIGSITGANKAAQAATAGAQLSADAQREGLEYLKETEAIPQELRQGALQALGGLFGLQDDGAQVLEKLKASPIYQNVLKGRQAGEEAILRNASATGGLRSGNVQDALARMNIELEQEALNRGLSGLTGLAQLPSMAPEIASRTAGIGQTLGQGQVAAGQAVQAGRGLALSGLISGASAFSDVRLKDSIKRSGEKFGVPWYTWTWNKEAEKLGLYGDDEGAMAHEVAQINPEFVTVNGDYLMVDYDALTQKEVA